MRQQIEDALDDGSLSLKDVVGLSDAHMEAVAAEGKRLLTARDFGRALAVFAMLASCDPLNPKWWEQLGDVHAKLAEPALAAACYEAVCVLRDRTPELARREAKCLRKIGQGRLAKRLIAATAEDNHNDSARKAG